MKYENLINRMIRLYGYEASVVITFCKACESGLATEAELEAIVENHERWRA